MTMDSMDADAMFGGRIFVCFVMRSAGRTMPTPVGAKPRG